MLGFTVVGVNDRRTRDIEAGTLPGLRPSAGPTYARLADMLIGEIRAGRLRVGGLLPGELDLCVRYGVSRHTVREALRRLSDLGLIARRRGAGTVVTARRPASAHVQVLHSPSELMSYPAGSRLVVRSRGLVAADPALSRLLQCPEGAPWFRVRALRRLGERGAVIGSSDIFLLPDYAAVASSVGRHRGQVFELIESRFGIRVESVQVDIRAGTLDAERAAMLDVAAGAPSLTVLRRYRDSGGRVFQVTVAEHPADRFNYSFVLQRGQTDSEPWVAA
jgi:DNA-binding GntR family transcriptional regulator